MTLRMFWVALLVRWDVWASKESRIKLESCSSSAMCPVGGHKFSHNGILGN